MTILFELHYNAQPGEKIVWVPQGKDLAPVAMHTAEGGLHYLSIGMPSDVKAISYKYELRSDSVTLCEKCEPRNLWIDPSVKHINVIDTWQWYPPNRPFFSCAFIDNWFARERDQHIFSCHERHSTVLLQVYAPTAQPDWRVGVVGEGAVLGNWGATRVLPLRYEGGALWSIEMDASCLCRMQQYKFVFYTDEGNIVGWDEGENRSLNFSFPKEGELTVVGGLHFAHSSPSWKGTGVAIPIFSLRSANSWGIGDFADLRLMIDWAAAKQMKVVQILPINDTTLTHTQSDSYPYNANSIYALHPLYLSMNELAPLADPIRADYYTKKAKQLNQGATVDYTAVDSLKWEYLRELWEQEQQGVAQNDGFRYWWDTNKEWVEPYVAYSLLRDCFHSTRFTDWGEYADYSAQLVKQLLSQHSWNEWGIYAFAQYELHRQMSAAHAHARSKGIVLKGDIPIGISPNSVEAWTEPHLFNLDMQAGAPPDDFSAGGQNWGFPTYNWEEMAKDGYAWWKRRLSKMANYFDAYRIDHLLGFFRIWEIPRHSIQGMLGHFNPALPYSLEELAERGFRFNKSRDTSPLFRLSYLHTLFGKESGITEQFFHSQGNGFWTFKPVANTQRGIDAALNIAGMASQMELREQLLALANGVLFVEDPRHVGHYHPRIGGYDAPIFKELDEVQQQIYRELHHHYFYERNDSCWRSKALERLPALLEATSMLVCAEDLGMIPACVPQVMRELQMLSLEIERMPKGFDRFGQPSRYPYLSVATSSTHDMSPIRLWWMEEPQRAADYYHYELHHTEEEVPERCTPQLAQEIINRHLASPSMLVILPLQDWLAVQPELCATDPAAERINVPADAQNYWRWRMSFELSALIEVTS